MTALGAGVPLLERLWAKVDKSGADGCWLWTGPTNATGYGQIHLSGDNHHRPLVHRLVYELLVGPIPAELTLDHLCRIRSCCNPGHLEPVSYRENLLRGDTLAAANAAKTHCPAGHPYDEANTYVHNNGRGCRICRNEHSRAYRRRKACR